MVKLINLKEANALKIPRILKPQGIKYPPYFYSLLAAYKEPNRNREKD